MNARKIFRHLTSPASPSWILRSPGRRGSTRRSLKKKSSALDPDNFSFPPDLSSSVAKWRISQPKNCNLDLLFVLQFRDCDILPLFFFSPSPPTCCADPVGLPHPLLALLAGHAGAAEGAVGGGDASVLLRGVEGGRGRGGGGAGAGVVGVEEANLGWAHFIPQKGARLCHILVPTFPFLFRVCKNNSGICFIWRGLFT